MANGYLESLLGEREVVLLATRRYLFSLLSAIVLDIVILVIIVGAVAAATDSVPVAAFGYILILIPLGMIAYDVLKWVNHKYMLTNRRVIEVAGVFEKTVTDARLEKINDVKMTQSAFGGLFGYGDLQILSDSAPGIDKLRRVGDAIKFKNALLNVKGHMEHQETGEYPSRNISAIIENLDDLRKKGILSDEAFERKKKALLAKI